MLTDGARADSVPNLEIETGEIVGAGHASATGRFDDEQLFYLCSRGIDAETARRLVVRGFFADVVQQIGLPELQDRLMGTIEARLGALPGLEEQAVVGMSFERVCALSDVKEPGSLRVELADVDIAVVRFEGEVYAIEDLCSHAEVPLSEGDVEEFKGAPTIECWLHGSCFDLRTGEPTNLPATEPVAVYPVRVEGEDVYVDTDARRRPSRRGQQLRSEVSVLEIRDLHVTVGEGDDAKEILRGVDLTVRSGETHAIMGPNGSGKSTLAYSIAGHPKYTITGGTVTLDGEDVLAMTVDERARAGLFLAMQYPVEVPGVSVSNFLRTAATAVKGEAPKLRTWVKDVKTEMAGLEMDAAFAERNVNEGFSGGEKKRHEILQMRLLKPQIAILDETDSGLDVDALRVVSEGVNRTPRGGRRRRPADHALHADPALHQARLRARLRRRPDRRGGRLRSSPRSSRTRATPPT